MVDTAYAVGTTELKEPDSFGVPLSASQLCTNVAYRATSSSCHQRAQRRMWHNQNPSRARFQPLGDSQCPFTNSLLPTRCLNARRDRKVTSSPATCSTSA